MIKTYGLTHMALAVGDLERSLRFYQRVFGVVEVYRDDSFLQVQTPGSRDVIAFEKKSRAGKAGGVIPFGFRLFDPLDIDAAARGVENAGGKILKRGEFCPSRFSSPPTRRLRG